MRDLKLDISVTLYESGDGWRSDARAKFDKTYTIKASDRGELTNEQIKNLIQAYIQNSIPEAAVSLFKDVYPPLNIETRELEDEIQKELKELLPNLYISGGFYESKFKIFTITNRELTNENVVISHPGHPNQVLTWRNPDFFHKLEDGTWTNVYQGHNYYDGIVERVAPPFDESILDRFFKNKGVPYEISMAALIPIPEPDRDMAEDYED